MLLTAYRQPASFSRSGGRGIYPPHRECEVGPDPVITQVMVSFESLEHALSTSMLKLYVHVLITTCETVTVMLRKFFAYKF